MQKIIEALLKDFDYTKALAFYCQTAPDGFLKTMLQKGENTFTREKLKKALQDLIAQMPEPSFAKQPEPSKEAATKQQSREKDFKRYGFSPTDPQEVLNLNAEWKKYYGEKKLLRSTLRKMKTDKERIEACTRIKQLRSSCIEIWFKLDTFQQTGKLPEAKQALQIQITDRAALVQRRNTLRVYLTPTRRKKTKPHKILEYEKELEDINKILDTYQ